MQNFDDILNSAQGGQLIANLAQRFGLSDEQIESAVKALTPALAIGLEHAAEKPEGLEKVVGAMAHCEHCPAHDEADMAHSDHSLEMGRNLLGDLFGSPEAAGQIVQVAARESGVRPDILSQLLPVLASVLLSGLFKSVNNQGLGGVLGQLANSGALGGILEQMLGGGGGPSPMPPGGGGGPMGPGPGGGLGRAPGGAAGGGLGGLLGGILGSLLGGRRAPPGYPPGGPGGGMGGGYGRRGPLDADSGPGGGGPSDLPEGMDPAAIQQAIEQIQKTLQVGRSGAQSGGGSGGGQSDIESLLGQLLGRR